MSTGKHELHLHHSERGAAAALGPASIFLSIFLVKWGFTRFWPASNAFAGEFVTHETRRLRSGLGGPKCDSARWSCC
jgi:hypothetical protein